MRKRNSLLDWLYPRRCPVCDGILEKQEQYICRQCAGILEPISEPRCRKCSRPMRSWTEEYCPDCQKVGHAFTAGFAVYPYHGPIQKSLMRFKYAGREEYAEFYAKAVCLYGENALRQMQPDCIVPVPVHRRKLVTRGYNQAEAFAVSLGRMTGIPVEKKLLLRTKNTLPQKELDPAQRRKNLRKAFAIRKDAACLYGKNVLLADDIYTTGSTVDTLAQLLLQHGVKSVCFVTVAIGTAR